MELLRRSIARGPETPSHPEVNQEQQTALEPNHQILAAAVNGRDTFALKLGFDFDRVDWSCQARVEYLDRLETTPDEQWLEPCAHGLDLWQLRHRDRA